MSSVPLLPFTNVGYNNDFRFLEYTYIFYSLTLH